MPESMTTKGQKVASTKPKRGKNFKVDALPKLSENDPVFLEVAFDSDLNIPLPQNVTSVRNIPLYKQKGKGFDPLLPGLYQVFYKTVDDSIKSGQKTIALATIANYYRVGLCHLSGFLTVLAGALNRDVVWSDINKNIIDQYIGYLADGEISYGSQKTRYTVAKSLLTLCVKAGLLPHITQVRDLFPVNPYPNSNKAAKGQRPFSKSEFKRVVKAVRNEHKTITEHDQPLTAYELGVCVLALAIRTGINPTPAVEMPIDCLQPHPLKEDRMTLVWFNRRGNATHIQAARKSDEVAQLKAVQFDVVDLIELVRSRNQSIRQGHMDPERLFVCMVVGGTSSGSSRALSARHLQSAVKSIADKNNLLDDDGKPLTVNLSRLRKTFVNRIFDLSGNDPLVTARHGGHSIQTANSHYWEPPKEAEANHKKMMNDRVQTLIATDLKGGEQRTPLAHCRDTVNGQRAPKNGEHCTEVLACFRCKSFVVTKDDLDRLYSFYWSLVEDRKNSDTKTWKKHFRHIRQVIDEDIAPQFDAAEIAKIKEDAKINRHPFWKDLTMLRMAK